MLIVRRTLRFIEAKGAHGQPRLKVVQGAFEQSYRVGDAHGTKLFLELCRSRGLLPYRHRRQHSGAVCVRTTLTEHNALWSRFSSPMPYKHPSRGGWRAGPESRLHGHIRVPANNKTELGGTWITADPISRHTSKRSDYVRGVATMSRGRAHAQRNSTRRLACRPSRVSFDSIGFIGFDRFRQQREVILGVGVYNRCAIRTRSACQRRAFWYQLLTVSHTSGGV